MKLTTKTRYGLRALIDIAKHGINGGVLQKDIAEREEISFKYLDHIINSLKSSGLIRNVGGRKSGYELALPAEKISVYDVYKSFEGDLSLVECLTERGGCSKNLCCAPNEFWNEMNEKMVVFMQRKKLSELIKRKDELDMNKEGNMYYI